MAIISINELTSGIGLVIGNEVYMVTEYHHVKPGKGSAFVRVKLKHIRTDAVLERTFRTAEQLETAFLEEKTMQYLYRAGESFHFMDQANFEEMVISLEQLGDKVIKYLQENMDVTVILYNHQIQRIILPNFITTEIIETEPGIKGDSSRAGNKPAKIDTGAVVQVPLFISLGDWVKIDTRNGEYVERVKK